MWRSIACYPELDCLMDRVDFEELIVARDVRNIL